MFNANPEKETELHTKYTHDMVKLAYILLVMFQGYFHIGI